MFLLDVNVWLALAFKAHVHHAVAKSWFEVVPSDGCAFCRLTQQGFLRLATNPKAVNADAVTLSEAWRMYDAFLGDPRVRFVREPAGLEALWRAYTQHQSFSPKVWNDAFLAAFARTAGYELITFDKGFAQYTNLNYTILS